MNEVIITKLCCLRCTHKWVPKQETVKRCPTCKSLYWNVEVPPKKGWPKGKKRK